MRGQLRARVPHPRTGVLVTARDADRAAAVSEVTLDLADDVRHRESRELDAARGLEPVDRLDEADGADLDEILQTFATMCVTPCKREDERKLLLDQPLSRDSVLVRPAGLAHLSRFTLKIFLRIYKVMGMQRTFGVVLL